MQLPLLHIFREPLQSFKEALTRNSVRRVHVPFSVLHSLKANWKKDDKSLKNN
jgi:hypothetical protein